MRTSPDSSTVVSWRCHFDTRFSLLGGNSTNQKMPGFIIRRIQPSFRQLPNDFCWESSPRIIGGYWRGHLWEGSPLGLGSLNVGCCPWYDWVISPTVYPFPSPQYRLHPAETQRNSLKIGYLHFRWMILTLPIIKLPFKKGMHCIIMKLVISHDIPRYSPEIPLNNP